MVGIKTIAAVEVDVKKATPRPKGGGYGGHDYYGGMDYYYGYYNNYYGGGGGKMTGKEKVRTAPY